MVILVDTNVIIEARRTKSWSALCAQLSIETVEKCTEEALTGLHTRNTLELIREGFPTKGLSAVHPVSDRQRANAHLLNPYFDRLDAGERDLWAHALSRADDWVLCGPDRASLRFGVLLGHHHRLVALEELLTKKGLHPGKPLGRGYTSLWHRQKIGELSTETGVRPS